MAKVSTTNSGTEEMQDVVETPQPGRMPARILVVEDEPDLRSLLDRSLERAGYRVLLAEDGVEALEKATSEPLDLILLDLMIPHVDGIEVCRRLKRDDRTARLPVIMLTAKQEPVDRIVGLELGADDYITKPFNLRELVLRVGAVLRRSRGERGRSAVLGYEGLKLDPAARIVTVDGEEIHLTGREFDLFHYFLSHPNRVFKRSELLRQVWEYDFEGYDRTVDAHVARLRRKLGAPGEWIETAWGIGYKFQPPEG
jgi:DNA-binding response OmpR family regulator